MVPQRCVPAAIAVIVVSGGLDKLAHVVPALPPLQLGLHLPPIVVSSWHDIVHGTQVAVIPRIP